MAASDEPIRFITVAEMTLVVNGASHDVCRSGGEQIELRRPADIEPCVASLVIRTFNDDGELISITRQSVRIIEYLEGSETVLRVKHLDSPRRVTEQELASELSADEVASLSR